MFPGFVYEFVFLDMAFIGERVYGGLNFPYIYFITSLALVFLVAHDAWRFFENKTIKEFVFLIISISALFLSGTRAAMVASIMTPVMVIFWQKIGKISVPLTLFLFILLFALISVIGDSFVSDMVSLNDGSNNKKIAYIGHYLNIYSDPLTLLFGQGFNAHVWSDSVNLIISEGASKTELTYLELVRVFGLPVALFLMFSLFYLPFSSQIVHPSLLWVKPAIFIYLLVSFLNPYLFSMNGMLLLGVTLAVCFAKNEFKTTKTE
jgi:hypothetical protein